MSRRLLAFLESFQGLLCDACSSLTSDPGLDIELACFIEARPGTSYMPARYVADVVRRVASQKAAYYTPAKAA